MGSEIRLELSQKPSHGRFSVINSENDQRCDKLTHLDSFSEMIASWPDFLPIWPSLA